jgi:hypothetical protein
MKFMLMMNAPKQGWEEFMKWPREALQAHFEFMRAFNRELSAAGQLVAAEGLDVPANARLVRAGKSGLPVTDGVFAETKEFLAGYWIVEAASADEAYQIAARASAAPGIGGEPMNIPIEVRQVMSGPPEL